MLIWRWWRRSVSCAWNFSGSSPDVRRVDGRPCPYDDKLSARFCIIITFSFRDLPEDCLPRSEIHVFLLHFILQLILWCAVVTDDKHTTCRLNATIQSVKVVCSWTTQLTATSCTTEKKTQTTYMMLSRCVTPLTESHFSRCVWHFSSLYSVHHTAFSVFDDTPSI